MKSTSNNGLRKAIFAGSFNPFTVGHSSIVERGLDLFDHIIIAVGTNSEKPVSDAESNSRMIEEFYNKEPRVSVIIWNGLMVDLARREGAGFFLRGVRNGTDFEYERQMADINRRIAGIETVLLPALPEHQSVTSSIVRELKRYHVDVSDFLPKK